MLSNYCLMLYTYAMPAWPMPTYYDRGAFVRAPDCRTFNFNEKRHEPIVIQFEIFEVC